MDLEEKKDSAAPSDRKSDTRADRLAAELRANLTKRKAQARLRRAVESGDVKPDKSPRPQGKSG